jgi:hypothetical protein
MVCNKQVEASSLEMSQVGEIAMTRLLEGIFVIGCSLVGFAMSAPEGSGIRNTMKCSIQLIAVAHNNIASNTANLGVHLAQAKAEILGNLRRE